MEGDCFLLLFKFFNIELGIPAFSVLAHLCNFNFLSNLNINFKSIQFSLPIFLLPG